MYLLSQKLELEPQHLWKLRSPKTSLTVHSLLSSWHTKSGLYFSSDFFQRYHSIDHTLSVHHTLICKKTVFHGSGIQFIFSLQNFIHFCLFAALMTFYIFRILYNSVQPYSVICIRYTVDYTTYTVYDCIHYCIVSVNVSLLFQFTRRNSKFLY